MESTDLTIEILKSIRDEVKGTNARLDKTNARLDETNARLDSLRDETNTRLDETNVRIDTLTRRVVESEIRTSTAITDLAGTVRELTTVLRTQSDLRPRVERCEQEIEALKHGAGR
ncbi:MAG: hypothetical protein ACLQVI_00060 [Polyangiaceae bacterium]